MIELGAMLLVCAHLNRASGAYQRKLDWLLLVVGGIVVAGSAISSSNRRRWSSCTARNFYRAVATAFPIGLIAISVVSKKRWPATTMAAIYTALFLGGLWIFPLFPAAPKLGPVYQNVTHMVPLWFPVLVIVPAFALDLLRAWMGEKWGGWKSAHRRRIRFHRGVRRGAVAVRGLPDLAVARNPIFGANYFGFFDPANLLYNPYHFALDKTWAAFAKE